MPATVLDRLIVCEEAFIAALDGDDVSALETSTRDLADAVTSIAAQGAWRAEPDTGARVVRALRMIEAARARVNYLADANRRRLEKLAQLAGAPLQAYNRAGRFG